MDLTRNACSAAIVGLSALLAPVASAAPLGVGTFDIGVYGAAGFPIAQEDVDRGYAYGAKARIGILPVLKAELTATLFEFSDGEETILDGSFSLPAPNVASYNLNGLLMFPAAGMSTYFTIGIGFTREEDSITGETQTQESWNLGVGATFGLPLIPLQGEISPRLYIIDNDGGTRKNIAVLVGVNYSLF